MDKIVFEDLPSTTTTVDADNLNTIQNNIETAINKKIDFVNLLTVNNTAPSACITGDKYYNTTNKLIYIATGTNTWDTVGETPIQNCLYIDNQHKILYMYNGINLEVYNITEKNILTANLLNNYTIQNTGSYEILPLSQYANVGNKLSVNSSGGIVIGAGVSYIKVSSNVSYNTVASANAKWNSIYKNASAIYPCPTYANNRVTIGNSGGIIPVTQGDVIYLEVLGTATDVIRGGTSNNYTCLTVEVIS